MPTSIPPQIILQMIKDQLEPLMYPDGTIPPVDSDRHLMLATGDLAELRRMDRRDLAPYLRLVATTPPASDKSSMVPPLDAD